MTPEKRLENRILDWLNSIQGCFAFKINTIGVFDIKRKVYRKNNNKHLHNGTSDIVGLYHGSFFAIEVKAGYNKPSPNQKKFLERVLGCDGIAFWTNNFEDAKKKFNFHFEKIIFEKKNLFDEEF